AKDPETDLTDYFDVIGGTSTGSTTAALERTILTCKPGNGPLFDGEGLHGAASDALKETRIGETLTNLVISAFDIKKQKLVVFSSYKVITKKVPYLNAFLLDICASSSTAATQFPLYFFENYGVEFNLVDGGEAALNPVRMVAVFWWKG
ncbi:hypothetical protein V8G54_012511, partial [Vigna mungo]